jgi:hypothetical protein
MEKKKILNDKEINEFLDNYFNKLEADLVAMAKNMVKAEMTLKTADDTNLIFPDEIQEARMIEVGTGPVKLEDGRLAVGDFVMPDGTKFTTDAKGIVIKVTHPTPDEIAAKIRSDMAAFREELKPYIVRKPFKAKAKPTGKRTPFHKPSK